MKIILTTADGTQYELYSELDDKPDLAYVIQNIRRNGHIWVSKKKIVLLSAVASVEVQE